MDKQLNKIVLLFSNGKRLQYKKGEIILRPDDIPQGVYYIEKGHVKVYSLTEKGDVKQHIIYTDRELFPLVWVFNNDLKNSYYEAMGDVIVRRVAKDIFLDFIKADSDILFELIQKIVKIYELHIDRIDTLESTKAYDRLVERLLSLAKRFGKPQGTTVVLDAPITYRDIAHSINIRHETLSRELEKLKRKGLIAQKGNTIVILNLDGLKRERVGYVF